MGLLPVFDQLCVIKREPDTPVREGDLVLDLSRLGVCQRRAAERVVDHQCCLFKVDDFVKMIYRAFHFPYLIQSGSGGQAIYFTSGSPLRTDPAQYVVNALVKLHVRGVIAFSTQSEDELIKVFARAFHVDVQPLLEEDRRFGGDGRDCDTRRNVYYARVPRPANSAVDGLG